MSVPNQTPYNIYTANGVSTVFPYEFMLLADTDLDVSINGTSLTTGYTVQGVGNAGGGEVVFVTPPANGSVVMNLRKLPIMRNTDYQDNGDLRAVTLDNDFDRLWMAMQQIFLSDSLSLKRPLFGGDYDAKGLGIINLRDPVNPLDATNKRWVESTYAIPIEEAKQAAREAKEARDEAREIADKFGLVDTAIAEAQQARDDAKSYSNASEDSANRAESAASAAILTSGMYENVEAAQAAANAGTIPANGLVSILLANDKRFVGVYKNIGGTITAVTDASGTPITYPSGKYVDQIAALLDAVHLRTAGIFTIDEEDGRTIFADKRGRMAVETKANGDNYIYGKATAYDLTVMEKMTMANSDMVPSDDSAYDFALPGKNLRVAFGLRNDGKTLELHGVPMTTQRGALPNDGMTTGDSINEFGLAFSGPNATGVSYAPCVNAQCWSAWAMLKTGAQYKYSGMAAKGGYTASQILAARIPKIIAAKPTFCIVMVGRNDVVQLLDFEEETKPAILQIYRQLRYAGILPVICTMSAQSGNTDAQNVLRYQINALCRAYAAKYSLPLVDLHAATTDPNTGEWYAGYNQTKPDGTLDPSHPTPLGAKAMGEALAEVLRQWLTPTTPRKAVSISTPESSDNKLPNPLFTEHSGGIPSGWVVDSYGTFSVVDEPGIVGNAFVMSGAGSSIASAHRTIPVVAGQKYGFGVDVSITANASIPK
ncbi:Uncharacterised protein [Serratia ficaria]|uniref:GDSL-type esterase/lipase family protein n=1 Tax=Serratia ficaria TaxID=61651 RepID=UPI002183DE96|nr:GDSL-type esterase/lipase family protein [Serratia ficaria]CAI2527286.1 Uncharacterised protein [Serratia ficaria]